AIFEGTGDRAELLAAHARAAELAARRGDVARAASHLATGAELARDMPWNRPLALIQIAAYVAYINGRTADAATLFGARLGLSSTNLPKYLRPILETLEKQGFREEMAAAAPLPPNAALACASKPA